MTATVPRHTAGRPAIRMSTWLRAFVGCLALAAVVSPSAHAAFGDAYDVADINSPGNQTVPAYPGTKAYWAGACDIGAAPPLGAPIPGGVGSRPDKISLDTPKPISTTHERDIFLNGFDPPGPANFPPGTKLWTPAVDAPQWPAHCIDYGVPNDSGVIGDYPIANVKSPATGHSWEPTPNDPPGWWTDPLAEGGAGESPFEPSWRLPSVSDAGAHPDGTAAFALKRNGGFAQSAIGPDGSVDNIGVALPPGFVGDPTALPKCTAEQFAVKPSQCPPESQVGISTISLSAPPTTGAATGQYPVYNLEPREGNAAELGIPDVSRLTSVRVVAKARTASDFGITGWVVQIPAALPLFQQALTIWGVPWAPEHDLWRPQAGFELGDIPFEGLPPAEQTSYDPSWGPIEPFVSNITGPADPADSCDGAGAQPNTLLTTDTFQRPGPFTDYGEPDLAAPSWVAVGSAAPALTRCDAPGFRPDIEFSPVTTTADGPAGLDTDLAIDQNDTAQTDAGAPLVPPPEGSPQSAVDAYVEDALEYWRSDAGRATTHLKDTVVRLPQGFSVNPAGATGLAGCPDSVVGVRQPGNPPLFNNVDPFDGEGVECPSGSKIGTVQVETPLLDEPLSGDVVLGEPKSTDPLSGEMFRLYLVVRDKSRGLVAKVYGSSVADPATGQLTTTFANNPQLPISAVHLDIKGGNSGVLAMPQRCGSHDWGSTFTSWARPGEPTPDGGAFAANARCAFGFAPQFSAGMLGRQGGGSGTFSFRFSRADGEQWFRSATGTLPPGLLAAVGDVQLCTSAEAARNACPAASRIGLADAGAGSGTPFYLERKGTVYLTEGYKGAPYGLLVSVPVEAGPFRGQFALQPIVVRQALHVDPTTAQATAVSDPFPQIWHGIPLRVREVTVKVDRPGFMRNPTDCSPKQVAGTLTSAEGTVAPVSERFQTTGCASLPFAPRLTLQLTGRKQARTGKHPGVRAQVTQAGLSEAGIERAVVRLPRSLALDPNNAQALCEFEDGTKPDLENRCPKGSIVGRARARTPLLKDDLAGNVYFVKNVRRDPTTGNEIRTLPMIIVALRGEIAINLKGESSTTKNGRLVNTFAAVPDAPVTRFNLNIQGGRNGILAVTRTRRAKINLCTKPRSHVADVDMDGHNGRDRRFDVRMKTPCAKKPKSRGAHRAKPRARRS